MATSEPALTLHELIEKLLAMREHLLRAHSLDGTEVLVHLWVGDDTVPVVSIDYDKFDDDEPYLVLITKDGDP